MRNSISHSPAASALTVSAFLCLAILTFSFVPALANWSPDGELICRVPGTQGLSHIISDGAGGAIVAWMGEQSPDDLIYAQRVDGAGNTMWTRNGITIPYNGNIVEMVTDGACGMILVWVYGSELFAARVDHSGTILWIRDSAELDAQILTEAVAVADGIGGVIVAWNDANGSPVYYASAQRLDSEGNAIWGKGGVQVSALEAYQDLCIASDGSGGAIIGYMTLFTGIPNIYAIHVQRVYGTSGMTWSTDGTDITTGEPELGGLSIDADAYGSAIVAWHEGVPNPDIYMQKLDPAGTIQWSYGLANVCSDPAEQIEPDILCDGIGGAFIVWLDNRGYMSPDVWGQRLDAYGVPLWTEDGVPIRVDNDFTAFDPELLGLYDSHVLVSWIDDFEFGIIYAQKIDHAGGMMWAENGLQILSGEVIMLGYDVMADESGSVFASTTKDTPDGDYDIYAIAVNSFGAVAAPAPVISSVTDVPDDQGGKVRLTIVPSDRDTIPTPPDPCTHYNVWQRIDGPVAMKSPGESSDDYSDSTCFYTPVETPDFEAFENGSKRFITAAPGGAFPGGTWEFIGSFDAVQSTLYYYRASTVADSSAAGIALQYYIVSAHTTNPATWFASWIAGGYSIDNLAPAPPLGLAGEQMFTPEGLQLTWDPNTENDLWYYAVYRGTASDFTPGPGNMIATPQSDEYFDNEWTWESGYWYKIAAVDINGNESGFALTGPGDVTSDDPMPLPDATFLSQNYPNPFNPITNIGFGINEQGFISLRIYDAAGRLVATLVDESRPAGRYTTEWNGQNTDGSSAASGVYFYRLITKKFEETKKMILLR